MKESNAKTETNVVVEGELKTKQIYIIGEIGEEICKDVLRVLFETDWRGEEITNLSVYIASEGGYLKDCFAMIDAIDFVREAFEITVTTFGLGEVASAGFFLFLIGDLRVLFPSCKVFVHEHITPFGGEQTYGERKREDKDHRVLYDLYVQYCAKRLDISVTRARNLLKKNRFLTANEVLKYNIVNAVDEDEEEETEAQDVRNSDGQARQEDNS